MADKKNGVSSVKIWFNLQDGELNVENLLEPTINYSISAEADVNYVCKTID